MPQYALDGSPTEAFGHPGACTEPAPGSVNASGTVRYNGTPIANTTTSTIEVPSHGHDTDPKGNCIDYQSHSIVPTKVSETVKYDGGGFFLVTTAVATDPGSGGNVDITGPNGNTTVSE